MVALSPSIGKNVTIVTNGGLLYGSRSRTTSHTMIVATHDQRQRPRRNYEAEAAGDPRKVEIAGHDLDYTAVRPRRPIPYPIITGTTHPRTKVWTKSPNEIGNYTMNSAKISPPSGRSAPHESTG